MGRVAMMVRQKDSISVHFTSYIRLVSKTNPTVCLFEGEDQKYYSVRLNLIATDLDWVGLDCGGKQNVLKLFELLSKHKTYKKDLVFAFVDRDFDEPLAKEVKGNRLYETPCYSIENLYCTDECLADIFSIEFKFDKNVNNPNLATEVLEHFRIARNQFHEAIKPLNLWIKAHRKKEARESTAKLNLQNVNFDKLIKIERNNIKAVIQNTFIPSLFPDCHALSYAEVSVCGLDFSEDELELQHRGKYELEFARQYLIILRNESAKAGAEFYNPKCPVKLSFSKGNFISEVSQYASTPNCLREFIKKMNDEIQLANA